MTNFHLPEDEDRLDFSVLRDGGISLYRRIEHLKDDIEWLRQQNYRMFSFNCERWSSSEAMHADFQRICALPSWYGKNLNALNDCLCSEDLAVPHAGGAAIVLNRFDAYTAHKTLLSSGSLEAEAVLSILARSSRYFLLTGRRLLSLVQSDDPEIHFDGLACVAAIWNWHERVEREGFR